MLRSVWHVVFHLHAFPREEKESISSGTDTWIASTLTLSYPLAFSCTSSYEDSDHKGRFNSELG